MKKIILIIGLFVVIGISSCTKHEYCQCYYTTLRGSIITQEYHLEDKSCATFIPDGWYEYTNPHCVKIKE